MTIGERLRKLRGKRSVSDVAGLIGVTESAIRNYESDIRIPRDEVKLKLSKLYGVPVGTIFFSDDRSHSVSSREDGETGGSF